MPRSTEMTFTCPCGETFPVTMYQTVNVTLEPELLYRLLAGTLNVAVCPNCGRKAMSAQPFIYHDMGRGLFAYVHPRGDVSEEEREVLLARLRQVYDRAVAESDRLTRPRPQPRQMVEPSVRRRTAEERARLRASAERMAGEIGCLVEVEDTPEEYTAWIYGPRDQVNLVGKALRGE